MLPVRGVVLLAVARQQKMVGRRWEQAAQTGVLLSGGDACELHEGFAQAAPLGRVSAHPTRSYHVKELQHVGYSSSDHR